MNKASLSETETSRSSESATQSVTADFTLYVVVTNRDLFIKECVESFRKFYPSINVVLVDNSGVGQFRSLGESLGLTVNATDRIRSVSENQNWILDHCQTKYFIFSADDIVFIQGGFLEEAVALHRKGFELVSLGVDDPCAFSMQTIAQPRIGRFNTLMAGKELTDMDIKKRCESVYGFLPSVGGYWRKTPLWWESKYITHRHDKPDVNQFLIERGMPAEEVHNERPAETYRRIAEMLYTRARNAVATRLFKYGSLMFRKGLHPGVFEMRNQLHPISWRHQRILSIGQDPRHYFWPYYLGRLLGAETTVEKVIIEKCEAYRPYLEAKFTTKDRYRVLAEDVLNVDRYYQPASVDLAVWFDGPEHLEKELSLEAIQKLERVTTGLILIGTPLGFFRQGADTSFKNVCNPYNIHRSGWETSEFEKLGYQTHVWKAPIPSFIAWKYLNTGPK